MTPMDAIFLIENGDENLNDPELVKAWQLLIDTGICWQLQGWFGRTAEYLIAQEICKIPEQPEENETINLNNKQNSDICEACECTPCDCGFGSY